MSSKITKLAITKDKIFARGGVSLYLRYIQNIKLYGLIAVNLSSSLIISGKGLQLHQFIKQMLAFFIDGTDMTMSGFDMKKKDKGLFCTA